MLAFSFLNLDPNFKVVEQEYVEAVYVEGDFKLIDNDEYDLFFKDQLISSYPNSTVIKIVEKDISTFIFSLEKNILTINEFDKTNNLRSSKTYEDKFSEQFNVYYHNDTLYFIGEIREYISEKAINKRKNYHENFDAVIIAFDDKLDYKTINVFGGAMNETFLEVRFTNSHIFISGKKDTLSGGDFGNGGGIDYGYFICKLTYDFSLINYVTINDILLNDFTIQEELLITTDSYLYKLDYDLKPLDSLKLNVESLFAHVSNKKMLIIMGRTEGKIYDLNNNQKSYEFDFEDNLNEVIVRNDAFLLRTNNSNYLYKIYDLRSIHNDYIYKGEIEEIIVSDMFKDISNISKTIIPTFNPLVFGKYEVIYYFPDFNINGNIEVPYEANVTESFIYPTGYELRFTGKASLNGNGIVNNHRINNPGEYQLALQGLNDVKTINFQVHSEQIKFTEYQNKHWDICVPVNQKFFIEIPFVLDDFEILNAWINGELYKCELVDKVLKVEIIPDSIGVIFYKFEGVSYKYNNSIYQYNMDFEFKANVLKNDLSVIVAILNNSSEIDFDIKVDDPMLMVRGFNIKVDNANTYLPLASKEIIINGLIPNRDHNISINLIYDQGDEKIKELELVNTKINSFNQTINIGEINILQMGSSIEQLNIKLNKQKEVINASCKNQLIYQYEEEDISEYIVTGIFLGIVSFSIIKEIRKRIRKRKSNIKKENI